MTIDELAHRTGTPTSTIRLYQAKGLLSPPRKEGRVGFYGQAHLSRLRLIAQLQADGFSLASIGRLITAWEQGQGLDDVLGLEAQVAATWGEPEPLVLRPDELAARFPGGDLPVEIVQRTLELGLIEVVDDRVVVHNPRLLDVGSELATLGIPLPDVIDEFEALQDAMRQIAARFTELFRTHLWEPFATAGYPADQLPELTVSLQHLSRLAEGVVHAVLRDELKQAASSFLADQARALEREAVIESLLPLVKAAGVEVGQPLVGRRDRGMTD